MGCQPGSLSPDGPGNKASLWAIAASFTYRMGQRHPPWLPFPLLTQLLIQREREGRRPEGRRKTEK